MVWVTGGGDIKMLFHWDEAFFLNRIRNRISILEVWFVTNVNFIAAVDDEP